jgi:beta-N-acetylhexosaminidase
LSPTWHNILRNDLGFDGIIITDDMTMLENSGNPEYADPGANAVRALGAGADVLLYVPAVSFNPDTVVQAVLSAIDQGILSEAAIRESVGRVATERRLMFAGAQTWVPPCDERCFIRITY